MKLQITLSLLSFSLILYSCKSTKEFSFSRMYTPPGTVKMQDNFYIDQGEITNLNYLEFTHWTGRVYGFESNEYKKLLPDTLVWNALGKCYENFTDYYFKHPTYRNAPVVGISYEQAKLFCKWRSDRVMEFILIRDGVLKYTPKPNKDSCFSIEIYFTGHYGKANSNIFLQYYPEYSLPDSITYMNALIFADSLNVKFIKKQKLKEKFQTRCFESIPNRNDTLVYGPDPLKFAPWTKTEILVNLKGNVRELTSDQNRTFGGSYIDSCKTVNERNFYPNTGPNCYTGFRCVCRFKKWDE